jgi:hypothetical protein
MPVNRSNALDERILERLAEGALVTVLCRDKTMPSIRQLQRWRRADTEFDERCWSAEGQGLMVQRSDYIEKMIAAVDQGGPGSSIQIQGLRELLHENGRTAGKLVARMNDRVRVEAKVQHMTISWQSEDDTAPDPTLINGGRDYIDVSHSEPILSE